MGNHSYSDVKFDRRSAVIAAGALVGAGWTCDLATAQSELEPAIWTAIPVADPWPAARWDHTLAALATSRGLLLFGGRDGSGNPFPDSWHFDLKTRNWTAVEGVGPAARFGQAIASIPKSDSFYLFGGQAGDIFYNDLWLFDSGEWTLVDDGAGVAPSPRYGTSLVLSPKGGLIVSHGFTFEGRFNDTWSFDLESGQWESTTPVGLLPERRCLHEAAWDAESNRILLFGGCSSGYGPCPQGDFWSLDPVSREWEQLPIDPLPTARMNPALIADPERDQLILFGGLTEAGYSADLWFFAGSNWTQVAQEGETPLPRSSHDLALASDRIWLFGGTGDQGTYNDLWYLDLD